MIESAQVDWCPLTLVMWVVLFHVCSMDWTMVISRVSKHEFQALSATGRQGIRCHVDFSVHMYIFCFNVFVLFHLLFWKTCHVCYIVHGMYFKLTLLLKLVSFVPKYHSRREKWKIKDPIPVQYPTYAAECGAIEQYSNVNRVLDIQL